MSSESKKKDESSSSSSSPPPQNMSEYCKSLETWLLQSYLQTNLATSAYYTALSLLYSNGANPANANINNNFIGQVNNEQMNGRLPTNPNNIANNNNINFRGAAAVVQQQFPDSLRIAPIYKRVAAEIIDFLLLLVIKIFITLSLIDNFDLLDLDSIDLDLIQDSTSIIDIASAMTSELILLELVHRFIVCFFEAYCIAKNGCTPGKHLMKLRVIHCEAVLEVSNRLVITPGTTLSFPRSLMRSFMKNFSIALFFPMCFTLLHFENNRTLYDQFAHSIVLTY